MRVLIIDDEKEICYLVKRTLEKHGDEVNTAHTVEDGRKLTEEPYDVVLLDIQLPDGNGIDMVPDIKSAQTDAKIIVISAYNLPGEVKKARKMGVDAFIGKPFSMPEISELINEVVS